jgi:hypothetical protein
VGYARLSRPLKLVSTVLFWMLKKPAGQASPEKDEKLVMAVFVIMKEPRPAPAASAKSRNWRSLLKPGSDWRAGNGAGEDAAVKQPTHSLITRAPTYQCTLIVRQQRETINDIVRQQYHQATYHIIYSSAIYHHHATYYKAVVSRNNIVRQHREARDRHDQAAQERDH